MLVVGLSGASSSGKSSLARFLREVLPKAVIIHEDDFYLSDKQIPLTKSGLQNWDCPEAFDLVKLDQVLQHARKSGDLPESHVSLESKIHNVDFDIEPEILTRIKRESSKIKENVIIVDGILLYQRGSPIIKDIDVKILITVDYETLKARREARKGYDTIEGYWADPPGYFDELVWPEYVRHYGYLHDSTGSLSSEAKNLGIIEPSNTEMGILLEWAVLEIQAHSQH